MALPLHILAPPTSSKKEYDSSLTESITSSHADSASTPRHLLPIIDITKPGRPFTSPRAHADHASDSSSDEDDDDDGGGADTPRPGSFSSSSALGDDYTIDEQVYVDVSSVPSYFPTHPLPEMQSPFEESMLDAGREDSHSLNYRETDPERFGGAAPARRSLVLGRNGAFDNISYSARWRATPDAKHHPIVKIMSQVIFGVHLLCQAMEQSVPEVAGILRGFVQELDGFLRRVNADLDLAIKDVTELHKNLSLPLQHVNVFDQLLDDRKYRSQTLEGNIRIDGVIKRYSLLVDDYAADLKALGETNVLFGAYLARIGDGWTRGSRELADVNAAMVGNTAIWDASAKVLGEKVKRVRGLLEKSALCVFEFEKRCAAAARRSMSASRASSRLSNARSFTHDKKPLPAVPSVPELSTPTTASSTGSSPSHANSTRRRPRRSSSTSSLSTPARTRASTETSTTSSNPPLQTASSSVTCTTVSTPATASIASSSRPSTSRSRLARPAGMASRSMHDLRAAGFVDSTSDLAMFLRTTAPDSHTTTITATHAPQPKPRRVPKKKSFGSFWQVFFRRKKHPSPHPFAVADSSDPSRPRTAPTSSPSDPPRPAHVPIAAFMGGVGQGPTGMGMSVGISMTMPATPGSMVSSEIGEKGRVRFDSVVGSGRQSRQSGRVSRGSGRTSHGGGRSREGSLGEGGEGRDTSRRRTESGSSSVGRLRLVFLDKFRA